MALFILVVEFSNQKAREANFDILAKHFLVITALPRFNFFMTQNSVISKFVAVPEIPFKLSSVRLRVISLFLQIREGSALARERRASKRRDASNEDDSSRIIRRIERLSFVSRLQPRKWSFVCLAQFAPQTKKKVETVRSLILG